MPNTQNWAIPYAGPNDAPNGYGQEQGIAEAVDAALTKVDSKPLCVVTSSQPTPTSSGTATAVSFDTEVIDTDNMHSVSSFAGTVIVPKAGCYTLTGYVTFVANASGSRYASILINTTAEPARVEVAANPNSLRATSIVTTVDTVLAAGDQVQLAIWQSSGANVSVAAGARLSVKFIHA